MQGKRMDNRLFIDYLENLLIAEVEIYKALKEKGGLRHSGQPGTSRKLGEEGLDKNYALK